MAFQDKKFLDAEGITHLVRLLDEYPNNQVLGTVIDAIEGELEQKAEKSEIPDVPVQNVQINGNSVLDNGIANIPKASPLSLGVVTTANNGSGGITIDNNGHLLISRAVPSQIKEATNTMMPIVPKTISQAAFYGLAKAAGADMASIADTTVGVYPDTQKTAIKAMLGVQDGLKVVRLI